MEKNQILSRGTAQMGGLKADGKEMERDIKEKRTGGLLRVEAR